MSLLSTRQETVAVNLEEHSAPYTVPSRPHAAGREELLEQWRSRMAADPALSARPIAVSLLAVFPSLIDDLIRLIETCPVPSSTAPPLGALQRTWGAQLQVEMNLERGFSPSAAMRELFHLRSAMLELFNAASEGPRTTLLLRAVDELTLVMALELETRVSKRGEASPISSAGTEATLSGQDLLAIAAHELRTPLGGLRLQLERLSQLVRCSPYIELPIEPLIGSIDSALRQGRQLTVMVRRLFDASNVLGGGMVLELERVELAELVRSVVGRLEEEVIRARCPIHLHASQPVEGSWDRLRLEQVVSNLMTNALKFAPGRPIDVTLELDGVMGRLYVHDRGSGIAPDQLALIFTRYHRASSRAQRESLGVGLYITRQIVEAHGGTIRVLSRLEEGTTFIVELPLTPS